MPLEKTEVLVGRDTGCDVVLKSLDVSRRHARFFLRGSDLLVEDLGSHNGVFVAGARIQKPTRVVAGAALLVGDVKVQVAGAQRPEGVGAGAVLRGAAGNEIKLPARAVVGRVDECDVVLPDDSVSRRHAELSRDDRGLYRVKDLGSANGTKLNGKPVGQEPVLVPEGAKLRFGDVELTLVVPASRARAPMPARRQKLLIGVGAGLLVLFAVAAALRAPRREPEEVQQQADPLDDARAALETERYDDAVRLAQQAVDADPIAQPPRKVLAQARREQTAQKQLAEASSKAQVGREDEALQLLARIPQDSRFFPRARIRAKEIGQNVVRAQSAACRSRTGVEQAEACAHALDIKCQEGSVENDPLLRLLRAVEKRLPHRVAWSCPPALAALFHDEAPGSQAQTLDEGALASLYPDPEVRKAVAAYARGDVGGAVRTLSGAKARTAQLAARPVLEHIKVVDGRYREGQTALLSGALDRADTFFGEALEADAQLMPEGVESLLARQMRNSLALAHGKAGAEKLARGQTSSAYDEWMKGLAVSPRDPRLLDDVARLEKKAEALIDQGGCDDLQTAVHITRADPPSPAHETAVKRLARCR